MSEAEEIVRFKLLTESILPALAKAQSWPIRLDHCFKRICLDYAFEDVWYNHLKRPAERHLTGEALARAIAAAEAIATQGRPALDTMNQASLGYRGKLKGR